MDVLELRRSRNRTPFLTEPYPGGMEDSYSIRGTPYANVVSHDPLLSMLGAQPALIEVFLQHQGHTTGKG